MNYKKCNRFIQLAKLTISLVKNKKKEYKNIKLSITFVECLLFAIVRGSEDEIGYIINDLSGYCALFIVIGW